MKFIITCVLAFTTLVSCGQSAEAAYVNRLHERKFQWLINKNYDSLSWLMDDQIQYIHSSGWIQTKQEVIDDLKTGKLQYTSVQVLTSSVRTYPGTAIVSGKGIFVGLMPDKTEFNLTLLYTEVYVKDKNKWKLVNRQATKL